MSAVPGRTIYDRLRDMQTQADMAARGQASTVTQRYYPVQYGAVADGGSHPLSDYYGSLAEAQVDYPCALDLTDEIDWCALQQALNDMATPARGALILSGTYVTNRPLKTPAAGYCAILGDENRAAFIRKTSNTVGSGTRAARAGAVTDDYAVDAILQIDHAANAFAFEIVIENVEMYALAASAVTYGIFAPRIGYVHMQNVRVYGCTTGLLTYQSFLVTAVRCSWVGAASTAGYGFCLIDDGSGLGGSTTTSLIGCYANQFEYGYWLFGLLGGGLFGCASDNIGTAAAVGGGIHLSYCYGTEIVGCTQETVTGVALHIAGGRVSVRGLKVDGIDGYSSGYATVRLLGCRVVLEDCHFDALGTPRGQLDAEYGVAGGSHCYVQWHNSLEPAGGATASYVIGCQITRDDGVLWGIKQPAVDNTAFDMLTFAATAGVASSAQAGIITGELLVVYHGRDTNGYGVFATQMYHVTVYCCAMQVMASTIASLSATTKSMPAGGAAPTLTVTEKAGTSNTALAIEGKVTHARFDGSANGVDWKWVGLPQGWTNSAYYIRVASA